jgi:CarD family transcriptional regulator
MEVAAVMKNLLLLRESKSLSFREKKMLERARYLLVSELALARNCEEADIETLLTDTLAKTNLKFPEPGEFEP